MTEEKEKSNKEPESTESETKPTWEEFPKLEDEIVVDPNDVPRTRR